MAESNVKEIMEQIPNYFNKELAKGLNSTIQFNLTGEQGGDWYMIIEEQTCAVHEGKIEKPNLTLRSDAILATKILSGEEDGMRAYMMGKLKLMGDLSLAMKLVTLFRQ